MKVEVSRLRVEGLRCRVHGSGFRVPDSGLKGISFRVCIFFSGGGRVPVLFHDSGSKVERFRVQGSGFRVCFGGGAPAGSGVWGEGVGWGFSVLGSEFRVQVLGLRV